MNNNFSIGTVADPQYQAEQKAKNAAMHKALKTVQSIPVKKWAPIRCICCGGLESEVQHG